MHLEHKALIGTVDGAPLFGTALHAAVLRSCIDSEKSKLPSTTELRVLLEAGADPDSKLSCPDNEAWNLATPLHMAALLGEDHSWDHMLAVIQKLDSADRCAPICVAFYALSSYLFR